MGNSLQGVVGVERFGARRQGVPGSAPVWAGGHDILYTFVAATSFTLFGHDIVYTWDLAAAFLGFFFVRCFGSAKLAARMLAVPSLRWRVPIKRVPK